MLNSLEIRNFRNLENLKINSLGTVNLFTGKNNTGKSTILEALVILATKGSPNVIYQLLEERGENYRLIDERKERYLVAESNRDSTELNTKALSSLFTNRKIGYTTDYTFSIGEIQNTLFGEQTSNEQSVSIRLVKYHDEIVNDSDIEGNQGLRRKRIIIDDKETDLVTDYNIGLEIRSNNRRQIIQLNRDQLYRTSLRNIEPLENYQFIRTKNIDRDINGKLWDKITLSEKEKYIIDALKIIEPKVDRIAFIEENSRGRIAVIKLKNLESVIPLKSMGDGINRVLTIILALVNSDNGFLLIDEFENGLHYTVQEKLWDIVFTLSQQLNVQVFATTHSQDCITSFEQILNNIPKYISGKLIRLDNINEKISQVEFSPLELKIATEQEIETR